MIANFNVFVNYTFRQSVLIAVGLDTTSNFVKSKIKKTAAAVAVGFDLLAESTGDV